MRVVSMRMDSVLGAELLAQTQASLLARGSEASSRHTAVTAIRDVGRLRILADRWTADPVSSNRATFCKFRQQVLEVATSLLSTAQQAESVGVRLLVLQELVGLCWTSAEVAALLADAGNSNFAGAVLANVQPLEHAGQQEEHLHALRLAQVVAEVVPEAPEFRHLLPRLADIATGSEAGRFPWLRAVRIAAVEVLVSLTHSRSRRRDVSLMLSWFKMQELLSLTSAQRVRVVRDEVSDEQMQSFVIGLLLANLSDLPFPDNLHVLFGELGRQVWQASGFFENLAHCLEASLRAEPWPRHAQVWYSPWKLCGLCARLVDLEGLGAELSPCLPGLLRAVTARGSPTATVEVVRASRSAAIALRTMAGVGGPSSKVRTLLLKEEGAIQALRAAAVEEPAAQDLLDLLSQES